MLIVIILIKWSRKHGTKGICCEFELNLILLTSVGDVSLLFFFCCDRFGHPVIQIFTENIIDGDRAKKTDPFYLNEIYYVSDKTTQFFTSVDIKICFCRWDWPLNVDVATASPEEDSFTTSRRKKKWKTFKTEIWAKPKRKLF